MKKNNIGTKKISKNVLVVENDSVLLKLITKYIKKEGYEVIDVSNGAEAIEQINF